MTVEQLMIGLRNLKKEKQRIYDMLVEHHPVLTAQAIKDRGFYKIFGNSKSEASRLLFNEYTVLDNKIKEIESKEIIVTIEGAHEGVFFNDN